MSTSDLPLGPTPFESVIRLVFLLLAFLLRCFARAMLYVYRVVGEASRAAGERLGNELTPNPPRRLVSSVGVQPMPFSSPSMLRVDQPPHGPSVSFVNGIHTSGMNVLGTPNTIIKKELEEPCQGCSSPQSQVAMRSSHRWYVVTRGTMVGVFQGWESAAPHVVGLSGAIFRSYKSQFDAEAAYRYAEGHGLLQVVTVAGDGIGQPHQ